MKKIYTEVNLSGWLGMVKLMELNISEFRVSHLTDI